MMHSRPHVTTCIPVDGTEPVIPCFLGRRPYSTYKTTALFDGRRRAVGHLSQATPLLQKQMLDKAVRSYSAIAEISDDAWIATFRRAAALLRDDGYGEAGGITSLASSTTGLPRCRVKKALETIAEHLLEIDALLAAQSPSGAYRSFRDGQANTAWRWIPAGKTLAVRVPGNFPTININWLLGLGARRPVLLCATTTDPITPYYLTDVMYRAGVPDGAISLCFDQADLLFSGADQVLWPGAPSPDLARQPATRVQLYHQGRSKLLILDSDVSRSHMRRLSRLVLQGCGRLCTNPSAILIDNDTIRIATELAEALGTCPILPLDQPEAQIAAFQDRDRAEEIERLISKAKARGAIDISLRVTGRELRHDCDGLIYLRPTVLLLDCNDPLFGCELPFAFVTVAEASRSEMARHARQSLIVSVIGEDQSLVEELALDPSIDKVFVGEHFDRGYQPSDPHQGFISDFLFRKKAVLQ